MQIKREPIVAGRFYESSFDKLNKQIESCFYSKFGPGDLPIKRKNKKIYGIISPHAGYQFSGPCQAWAYKEIAESNFPERYVIIGPNHNSYKNSTFINANWLTPFGEIKVDKEYGRRFLKFFSNDFDVIKNEHSIEVQLPFLQFVNKDKLLDLKFLPLQISDYDYESCKEIAKLLKGNICIIASSDFTHYGYNYGFTPFNKNIKENLYNLDKEATDFILKLDAEGFLEYSKKTTICGSGPIAITIEAVKNLGAKKGRLLRYYTSGDILNDYTNSVGYAAIVFV